MVVTQRYRKKILPFIFGVVLALGDELIEVIWLGWKLPWGLTVSGE